MITVEEALKIINNQQLPRNTEEVSLESSIGRVLAEPLIADRDFPPFNRVTMDGIAIQYLAFVNGQRAFAIEEVRAAGTPQGILKQSANCFEIMTGAVLPANADTIIRYEDVEIKNGVAHLLVHTVKEGQNIHRKGEDRKKHACIVEPGTMISSTEIAVAATVGKHRLKVTSLPKVAVVSTGDELVNVSATPAAHQIRSSNASMIIAALDVLNIQAYHYHLLDDPVAIETKLLEMLELYDVLILSGGVSKGKFDYLPKVLNKIGVQRLFHKIKQRPGKPFWFGATKENTVVFALPGNPVSTFVCTQRYVLPWLSSQLGIAKQQKIYARLAIDLSFKSELTYFVPVKLQSNSNGILDAFPIKGNGSGDLANLTNADGFLELPPEKILFQTNEVYPCFPYRKPY